MTVFLYTLGCKLNQSETEALAYSFQKEGFAITAAPADADIAIINTCTVTSKSDQKARRMLRFVERKLPRALIIFTGCYAQVEREFLIDLFEKRFHIAVVSQEEKPLLLKFPEMARAVAGFADLPRIEKWKFFKEYILRHRQEKLDPFSLSGEHSAFHARAFLKIEDGCDAHCAFCRVPSARGKTISLENDKVMEKIKCLIDQGFQEIVFTGVNISAYKSGAYDLAALLEDAIVHTRNVRFRLSSLEPEAISQRLSDVLRQEAVCPHFHLPIQSGSDLVLSRMRRTYSVRVVYDVVAHLKSCKPDAFIAADFLVGFPGESDADFAETKRVARDLGLAHLHVFPFSRRPGTVAFAMKERVPEILIRQRAKELVECSHQSYNRYIDGWKGKDVDVILERDAGKNAFAGSSAHSVKCLVEKIPSTLLKKRLRVKARVIEPGAICRAFFTGAWEGKPEYV
jgi:threonylcarbamoyladenosine tRNA methylthiotransferase MtaB